MQTSSDFFKKVPNDLTNEYIPSNADNILFPPVQTAYNFDMHVHSKNSTDGYMDVVDIINRCVQNGVEYTSITDHNSFEAIKTLRKHEAIKTHPTYFEYDGVKVFTGTEVSCVMYLNRQTFLKLHMLCYGFDIDCDNIFIHMLTEKGADYLRARYYPLYYLTNIDKMYSTTLSEFKQFAKEQAFKDSFTGRINLEETVAFYKWKGIPEYQIKQDLEHFDFTDPVRDNIRLDVVDVINATHAAGGYCIVAHPIRNYERFRLIHHKKCSPHAFHQAITDKLISVGCDGIEYSNLNDELSKQFNNNYSNLPITSCGSDTHYYGSTSIHDIGQFNEDMPNASIVNRLLELDKAKRNKERTKIQKQTSKIDNQNTYIDFDEKSR